MLAPYHFMKRKTRTIKYKGSRWTVKGLIPRDFIEFNCFPLAYFSFPESPKQKNEVKRDWKTKSKKQKNEEAARARILTVGIVKPVVSQNGFGGLFDVRNIEADEMLYGVLLGEVYALTFELTNQERLFAPQKKINREFAENLYFVCKLLQQEPFSLYQDVANELPALQNPKRWDFNQFILAAGLERERAEQEKAMADIKTKQGRR